MSVQNSLWLGIILWMYAIAALAETCPTIDEIKDNHLHGWHVVKKDVYTPASESEILQFQNQATYFTKATWMAEGKIGGTAYCAYSPVFESSQLFLSRFEVGTHDVLSPGNPSWIKTAFFYTCHDGILECNIS